MILQVGFFQFDVNEADGFSYHLLARVQQWKWEEVPIVENTPILQYSGKEAPTITFSGTLINYHARRDTINLIEEMADLKEPVAVTGDDGRFYGFHSIVGVQRNEEIFRPRQRTGLQTAWTLSLKYYGMTKDRTAGESQQSAAASQTSPAQAAEAVNATVSALLQDTNAIETAAADTTITNNTPIEFDRLTSQVKSEKPKLENIQTSVAAIDETDLTEAPDSFFDSIKSYSDILDTAREKRRLINTTLSRASRISALRNNSAFQTLKTSLQRYDTTIWNAQNTQRQVVNNINGFRAFQNLVA